MKGIDIPIQSQVDIFKDMWTGTDTKVYGRIFRNERDGNNVPEALDGNEYKEVLIDDTKDGICFFDVRPEREINGGSHTAVVDVYFAVNLSKLYPSVTERATEYMLNDILKHLQWLKPLRIVTGTESFATWDVKAEHNMQPFFLLRIETIVNYKITC